MNSSVDGKGAGHLGVPQVDVALATYNGQRYLSEFLDSVSRQSLAGGRVCASDDGSDDATVEILKSAASVSEFRPNVAAPGIVGNFISALALTQADYVALADQDDVWSDRKLEFLVSKVVALEAVHGKDRPILVFSDLEIVGANLRQIYPSFYAWSRKSPSAKKMSDFILSNHIPGCCMMMNRALVEKSAPMPAGVRMHDWWIALVAASVGTIDYLDQPLIKYRQHGANSVGVPDSKGWRDKLRSFSSFSGAVAQKVASWKVRASIARYNAKAIYDLYGGELSANDKKTLEGLLSKHDILSRLKVAFFSKSGESTFDAVAIALMI